MTLIELLVVFAIIGLLSTVAILALGSARQKARDSARLSDLGLIRTGLERYFGDNNMYPIASNAILGSGNFSCLNNSGWQTAGCANPYAVHIPRDPGTASYLYTAVSPGTSYLITATLEGSVGGLIAGTIHVTPAGISK